MITDAILVIFFGLADGLVGLFPVVTLPPSAGLSALAGANVVFPFDVMFNWLGVSLILGSGLLVFWLGKLVLNLIRGSGA